MRSPSLLQILTLVLSAVLLSACGSMSKEYDEPAEYDEYGDNVQVIRKRKGSKDQPVVRSVGALQARLGMNRKPSDLGYSERAFNPCHYGMSDQCSEQYLTVIHFQLLCRDSEGTVSVAPVTTPIASPQISWSVAGQTGGAPTDRNGYGRLTVVSERPIRENRLIIRKGPNYVGVSVGDISKIVLPKNWCGGGQG
jgi:hypothetical protein